MEKNYSFSLKLPLTRLMLTSTTKDNRIFHLIWLYTNTLTEIAANRALAEIAKLANLPLDSETVLQWVDTNYPNAYRFACHQPKSGKWLITAADVEELL